MKQLPLYAPTVLRLGLAAVFILFGMSQIVSQEAWVGFIPTWVLSISHLSGTTFVMLNGIFEVICAGLLALNLFIRPIAFLLFLHMCGIVLSVGVSPTGVRDPGIAVGLLSLSLFGDGALSLDTTTNSQSKK